MGNSKTIRIGKKISISDRIKILEKKRQILQQKYNSQIEIIDNTIKYWEKNGSKSN